MKSSAARVTWILAVIAVILLVAVAVVVALIFNDRHSFNDETTDPTTSLVTATDTPPPQTTTQSAAIVPSDPTVPSAPAVTTEEVVPEPTASNPISGGPCLASEARTFATSADGQDLVCNYLGADGGYVWVGHAENDGTVHSIGDPCGSSVDRVAQNPSGKAIMCDGDTWVAGP
ncbi:hypothetical protein L5G32_08430 [Gordonia sp. HY002]|uniref:hypothetical protein n=1 Tax=Gordonia zhenghanii TaxID=2911516 RepID=UPI001EEF8EB1|nr:hypothetical protein [Gordonia zhenghanii]MCF8570292.1 hypothetical protein [Gordonia zhenghanii]MCF8605551.1 hypothetical protein [Gordonia zhenghanii]